MNICSVGNQFLKYLLYIKYTSGLVHYFIYMTTVKYIESTCYKTDFIQNYRLKVRFVNEKNAC